MALHNFIRDSAIHDAYFENYNKKMVLKLLKTQQMLERGSIDDSDMGALRDCIAAALVA
jgi:hypothetical protein